MATAKATDHYELKMLDSDSWNERIKNISQTYDYPVLAGWWSFGHAQVGLTFPTPVANADAVFAKSRGTISAFSHDGSLLWSFNIAAGGQDDIASPRLHGDKVLVNSSEDLYCLDAKTGKLHYHVRTPSGHNPFGMESLYCKIRTNASPHVLTIDEVPVVITTYGRVVRIEDGKLFEAHIPHIFLNLTYNEATAKLGQRRLR